MLLSFTEIDLDGTEKNYSWWYASMEVILDVLNCLIAKGRQVIQAEFIDNGQHTQLSIEAFDGDVRCFSAPLQQLESQWQLILAEPTQASDPESNDTIPVLQP